MTDSRNDYFQNVDEKNTDSVRLDNQYYSSKNCIKNRFLSKKIGFFIENYFDGSKILHRQNTDSESQFKG